jgi:hypothetical protein
MLDYTEFEKFANELASKFPAYALESGEKAMTEMADYLLGLLPEYPEETLGRIMPPDGVSWLKTDKQRRWFFAAVRSGEVRGWEWVDGHLSKKGGGRTGNFGRASDRNVYLESNSVVAELGYNKSLAPYAPWVVGPDYPGELVGTETMYQAQIHVDRWWQFGSIIAEGIDEGWKLFGEIFWEEFSKRVNGG